MKPTTSDIITNKCFLNSLKKDYMEIVKWTITICCVVLGLSMVYTLNQPIINFIKNIPASYISVIIAIGMPSILIYDLITTSTILTKKTDVFTCIFATVYAAGALMVMAIGGYMVVLSLICGLDYYNGGRILLENIISESGYALAASGIITVIAMPIALAYARCKDNPEKEANGNGV